MDSTGGAEGAKGDKAQNPSDLISGSIGSRSLQDIAGMEVSNVFGSFSTNLQRQIDLTNAFKSHFFVTILLSHAATSLDSLENGVLVAWGARARAHVRASPKVSLTLDSHSSIERPKQAMRN